MGFPLSSLARHVTRLSSVFHFLFIFVAFIALTACGGGGGGDGGGGQQAKSTPTYTVDSSAGSGGSISPSQTIDEGASASFTVTPDTGYVINTVSGCGGSLSGNTYTTAAITADCTVTASFSIISYTVSTSAGPNGSIAPADATVNHGSTTSFTITPDTNYVIDSVSGCDGSLAGDTYTTGAITVDCTVSASFKLVTHSVSTSAGPNGSISPADATVDHGGSTSFTITPDTGYVIDSVTGCDGTLTGDSYTTGTITADCTVSASFSIISYTVSTSAGANGSISPTDAIINYGNSTSFTITPDTNYVIDSVSGCDGSLTGDTYTTGAITADCTVSASFTLITYTVSTSAGANGSISPADASVEHGSSTSFTIMPDTGYLIDSVSGCNGSLVGDIYTTDIITANCTVSATFIARTLGAVTPLFPNNGVNWNDYIQGGDFGSAADNVCDVLHDLVCLHGGEYRVVEATGKTSCVGLTATDALGAFNWICDESTGTARLISTRLADGKYLSDLIDFTTPGFNTNAVTVYEGGIVWGTTPSSVWWSNPVEINHTGGSLDTASTIYLVTSNLAASYTLAAEKAALVVQPGVTLTGSGEFFTVTMMPGNFFWFEGSIEGGGISVNDTLFSQLRGATVNNAPLIGISIIAARRNSITDVSAVNSFVNGIQINGSNNSLTNVTANNNSGVGIQLDTGTNNNTLTNVIANNNAMNGIGLNTASYNAITNVEANNNNNNGVLLDNAADNNTFTNVIANNNGSSGINSQGASLDNRFSQITASNNNVGISLNNSSGNKFSGININNSVSDGIIASNSNAIHLFEVVSANNGGSGIALLGSLNNTLDGITTVNNSKNGIYLQGSNNTLNSIVSGNNTLRGLMLASGSDNNTVADLTAAHNSTAGIVLSTASNNTFTGLLNVGNNANDCIVTGGTNPGLANATCASPDATLATNVTLNSSFVGKASSDSHNTDDTNGTADFSLIDPASFDWNSFENNYRAWGIDGSASFPNDDQRGQWTTGIGRIYDWSLAAGDTGNSGSPALLRVIPVPTGDDFITHTWDVSAAATAPSSDAECDAIVAGSSWDGTNCVSHYLRGAMEVIGDSIGNDNGLCESDETCIYMPNIGSYQGHGNLISAGDFVDGAITGVTLLKYEMNGVF